MSSTIHIWPSPHCAPEQQYVINWVIGEVFGINVEFEPASDDGLIKMSLNGSKSRIELSDCLFKKVNKNWLQPNSLPSSSLSKVGLPYSVDTNKLSESEVVVFVDSVVQRSNNDRQSVTVSDDGICNIPFDLFGSLFFLISRYEEAVSQKLDKHQRFPASASMTATKDLVERAIGNEYIELLWSCFSALWPNLQRNKREFRVLPSHDIDYPSYFWNQSHTSVLKKCCSDVVRKRDVRGSMARLINWTKLSLGKPFDDPFDKCDWLMDQSEQHNLQSAFYYIPVKTHANDPGMPIDDARIIDQWQRIAKRGHELGYHPGYNTFESAEAIQAGATTIRNQLQQLDLGCELKGGRQHVLRWKTPETALHLESAGMSYDSTLGYAERPGFRCGVCYEYPMYDLIERRQMSLRQRPLIAMDVSVSAKRYMGLSGADAFDCFVRLKRECEKFCGDFTLLWHNTELLTSQSRELYTEILNA